MRTSGILATALFLTAGILAAAEPEPTIDVVLVTGEQPGPALWKITSGHHSLWLLGEVAPLPRKVKWRSRQFESLLANSQEVILHDDSHMFRGKQAAEVARARALPDDQSLSELLSPDLRSRVDTVAKIYGVSEPLEGLSPSVVGTRLANASLKALDLKVISLQASVLALARKAKVRVSYYSVPHIEISFDEQVQMIKDNAVATCPLEKVISVLEDGGGGLRRLANAWSTGDIAGLRLLVPSYGLFTAGSRTWDCPVADHSGQVPTATHINRRAEAWMREAERALRENVSTLAVVPIPELFADDGYLAALRAKGYEVQEPD